MQGVKMEIERINTYEDSRFSQKVLQQHGCFLADGVPCEVEIISDFEAVIHKGAMDISIAVLEDFSPLIDQFRFYTPHITRFYDENRRIIKDFPAAQLLTLKLEQIQPSQFYVDRDKIAAVSNFIHKAEDIIIQVLPYQGRFISLDGHTRLYYAVMQGWEHVRAVAETDDGWVHGFVEEAKKRSIYTPADLIPVSHAEYVEKWDGFCDAFFAAAKEEQSKS